jgi:hypothetical protein
MDERYETMTLRIPVSLFSLLRLETNYPSECPDGWAALAAVRRSDRDAGLLKRPVRATVSVADAINLYEYLDGRCRVRDVWDGPRYQRRADGTWPGQEGRWAEGIRRQLPPWAGYGDDLVAGSEVGS